MPTHIACVSLSPVSYTHLGLTAEQFLAEYPLKDAQYIFHSPNGSDLTLPLRNCYRVPNEWILDAVNTGCRDAYYIAPWDASLDADVYKRQAYAGALYFCPVKTELCGYS